MNQTIVLLLNFSCVAHLYVLIAIQQLSELLSDLYQLVQLQFREET
jgi:hypothetical protein